MSGPYALLRKLDNEFSIVTPDKELGVLFVPLSRDGDYLKIGEAKVFRDLHGGRFVCLVDAIISIP
jgi:hypothetical protein